MDMIARISMNAKNLIRTPSFNQKRPAQLLEQWFQRFEIPYSRHQNNVWEQQINL